MNLFGFNIPAMLRQPPPLTPQRSARSAVEALFVGPDCLRTLPAKPVGNACLRLLPAKPLGCEDFDKWIRALDEALDSWQRLGRHVHQGGEREHVTGYTRPIHQHGCRDLAFYVEGGRYPLEFGDRRGSSRPKNSKTADARFGSSHAFLEARPPLGVHRSEGPGQVRGNPEGNAVFEGSGVRLDYPAHQTGDRVSADGTDGLSGCRLRANNLWMQRGFAVQLEPFAEAATRIGRLGGRRPHQDGQERNYGNRRNTKAPLSSTRHAPILAGSPAALNSQLS